MADKHGIPKIQPVEAMRSRLKGIDGKDYGAYQSLLGGYGYEDFELFIDQIPKDPYAPPHTGIYRARVPFSYTFLPRGLENSRIRRIAYRDFLARRFFRAAGDLTKHRGTGYSGLITVAEPGQAVLERSSVVMGEEFLELRFFIGLPAGGRIVKAGIAETMLFRELPEIIEGAFRKDRIDEESCLKHLGTAETCEYLRSRLEPLGLVCFAADDSVLPRKSGTSDEPLDREKAVPFRSPPSLRVGIPLPDGREIRGMGIPEGITLIVGGGYHGKSTLLQAIAAGVYNHIPGDGRERVVSNPRTLKIRSYSGRFVEKVNISPFIDNLPSGDNTTAFSTENASGSTSQAAALMEGLEAGAEVFLMDEDTCASNFMIRDEKMQKLVRKADEPITPFIDRARQLYSDIGVSAVLVLGGSGDYFSAADTVIQMNRYVPLDVTDAARKIAAASPVTRQREGEAAEIDPGRRIPVSGCIDPLNRYGKKSVYAKEVYRICFGKSVIDLTDVEQLLELSQTKGLMHALQFVDRYIDDKTSLGGMLEQLRCLLEEQGLDVLSDRITGNLAEFRMLELACTLNRMRTLQITGNR